MRLGECSSYLVYHQAPLSDLSVSVGAFESHSYRDELIMETPARYTTSSSSAQSRSSVTSSGSTNASTYIFQTTSSASLHFLHDESSTQQQAIAGRTNHDDITMEAVDYHRHHSHHDHHLHHHDHHRHDQDMGYLGSDDEDDEDLDEEGCEDAVGEDGSYSDWEHETGAYESHQSSAGPTRPVTSTTTITRGSLSQRSSLSSRVSATSIGPASSSAGSQHHRQQPDSIRSTSSTSTTTATANMGTSTQPSIRQDNEQQRKEKEQAQVQQQSDLRRHIVAIQQDSNIPPAEKAKKIQELMTNQWNSKQKTTNTRGAMAANKLEHKRSDFSAITDADRAKTYHDKDAQILGCKHYQRATKLQAHCCGKWYTCRFCHDEVSDHNIIRNLTTTMMCMYCGKVQPAGQDCVDAECKRRVSKYYCKECKLWDDDQRKNIYHCYDCGICRIGKGLGQDYFHCKKCNVCMAISLKGRHKCIERNLESDCPICGEYMFTSTTTVIFMPCGHCIHYKCHQEYIQTSYQCPTCFKSLANMTEYFKRIDAMLAQHQMPTEYDNSRSLVYCNDCEKRSWAKFHFLYHKCAECKGYNTKILKTVDIAPGQPFPGDLALEAKNLGAVRADGPSSSPEPIDTAATTRTSASATMINMPVSDTLANGPPTLARRGSESGSSTYSSSSSHASIY
ncbi:hypothetical protein SeLEV6574_g05429 [Synchytrium endobioticum]|uniref:RING-type domain-containing protein n=1 Tax=Synchytrium endobioticum TaxID=286115 RepID=A0A507CUC7_9FUNG|nr:hypothetical protein SeLEV6574_g05429 [Synchytrium endobioticum]